MWQKLPKSVFSMSLVDLIACRVKIAGVGECSISVIPGEVQIRFVFHVCLWKTKLGLLNKIRFFLTK